MDDFLEDAIPHRIEQEPLQKKKFMPWHKPRKHWSRFYQWYKGMNWVIDNIGSESIVSFNYLGLPGEDLLDLRLFAYGCKRKAVKLKYLGFITHSTTELDISESELNKTEIIESGSAILNLPIETLSRKDSSSFANVRSIGHFHLINLDLCNSIAKNASTDTDNYFLALANLVFHQLNYMRDPWVLFITTEVTKETAQIVMPQFLNAIHENLKDHETFSQSFEEKILVKADQIKNALDDFDNLSPDEFFDCFTLGLCKWLLKLITLNFPQWTIEMTDSCKYGTRSNGSEPNMLSLGFKLIYKPKHNIDDKVGIIKTNKANDLVEENELSMALKLLQGVENLCNLDLKINADKTLRDNLIKNSKDLLEQARYEPEDYLNWVEKGCPTD